MIVVFVVNILLTGVVNWRILGSYSTLSHENPSTHPSPLDTNSIVLLSIIFLSRTLYE